MFFGPHKMKMSHYLFSLWNPLDFRGPPPNFELFPTESWDFFDFLTTPPLFGPFPKFPRLLLWKASLRETIQKVLKFGQWPSGSPSLTKNWTPYMVKITLLQSVSYSRLNLIQLIFQRGIYIIFNIQLWFFSCFIMYRSI